MKNLTVIFFIVFSSFKLNSETKFTASVNKNPVSVGEQFQLSFSFNADGTNFKAPSFPGFNVLTGPNQSTSMQIINRSMSKTITYSYVLTAKKIGTFNINPASIKYEGKTYRSNPVKMQIVKMTAQQQVRRKQETDQAKQANDIIRKNIWVSLSVNKKNVYKGEQIIATYKLYKHPDLPLVDLDVPKTPAFTGFWSQDIETISQLKWGSENRNGVRYQVATLKRTILLPQETGKLTVDPIELNCTVRLRVQQQRRRSRDIFDRFFDDPFGSHKDFDYTAKAKPVTINVKPLPEPAPLGFSGGVGDMKMKAWLDKTKTKTNEPVTLKIQVAGTGNIRLVEPDELVLPPDIDSYEPKVADNLSLSPSGFKGNKTFEYLLIPRHAGEFEIDPVTFSYFDLRKGDYETFTSEKFVIEVEKGDGSEDYTIITGVSKEGIKYLGKDIRYIKDPPKKFSKAGQGFYGSAGFIGLSVSPLLLFILFLFVRKRNEELNRNKALLKNRQANKLAKKRLALANQFLKKSDKDGFYEEVAKALWGYLSDKLSIQFSDLTKDSAKQSLLENNIAEDTIDNLLDIIDHCEFARYAPESELAGMDEIYSQAVLLITELEGGLK